MKQFNDKDFTAIKRFLASGVKVCFLSGDANINEAMARNRNIDFFLARAANGIISKSDYLPKLTAKYGVNESEIGYIGDDLFDQDIIQRVPFSFCPKDAIRDIKDSCFCILDCNGGDGVIAALYEVCLRKGLIGPSDMEEIRKIDAKEKN
jgi:3-deoxy-D-manno-octulosonate 8-phosphate phosphatase (KDO 8-P phosphatase)